MLLLLLGFLMQFRDALSSESNSGINMVMLTPVTGPKVMIENGTPCVQFIYNRWQCSWNSYIYNQSLQGTGLYVLEISDLSQPTNISIST